MEHIQEKISSMASKTKPTKHLLQTQPETQILLFWSPGKADDPHHPGDDEAAAQLMQAIQSQRLTSVFTSSCRLNCRSVRTSV